MPRVLLIEDDAAMSASLEAELEGLGLEVRAVPTAELGLEEAQADPPALILLDLHLPGRSGLDVLPDLLAVSPPPPVVVITAQPTAENAIDAMSRGASAHLAKPVAPEELAEVVGRVLASAPRAHAPEASSGAEPPRLVGTSRAMLDLGRRVGALARSDCTVLIRGESGTGKELVARAIHERSERAAGPFVPVSCAALPEALLEAELFGHVKGAFTGAHQDRAGRVERAAGGTLFLDEVGELTPAAQAKLLRFLEERTFERVGEGRVRSAEVRVLAATNAPLEALVEDGSFRRDLYYRLDVARVTLPSLRERSQDVPLLVEHFLARAGRGDVQLQPSALSALLARSWPGNVRELRNVVQASLVALGDGAVLRPEHLPPPRALTSGGPSPLSHAVRERVLSAGEGESVYDQLKAEVERAAVSTALEVTGGNQVAAAKLLGMNRATFRRKLEDHGLRD